MEKRFCRIGLTDYSGNELIQRWTKGTSLRENYDENQNLKDQVLFIFARTFRCTNFKCLLIKPTS